MKIAVLGGGNGCYAAAADLTEQGHEVCLWRRDGRALQQLLDTRTINLRDDQGSRPVTVSCVTTDIAEAVRGAQLILIPLPAFAQLDIARALAAVLEDDQVVYLPPGSFGGYVMSQTVRRLACNARVAWAETATLPWLARKHEQQTIAVTMRAVRLPTGVYPASETDRALDLISNAFPCVTPCEDVLSAALLNAGPIIHPPLVVLSAAPLQHFNEWDIHNEGTQVAVRAVTTKLDSERIAIRKSIGYDAPHYPLSDHYTNDKWLYGSTHEKLVDSGDWREHIDLYTHRYVTEDIAIGLAFMVSVAEWVNCKAPVATGLLAIAGAAVNRNFRTGSRTMEGVGLSHLSISELRNFLVERE